MSETTWLWTESFIHWLLAWSLVVAGVVAWMWLGRVRRSCVRYVGWLVATFAGVVLLPAAVYIAPVVSWRDAFDNSRAVEVSDIGEMSGDFGALDPSMLGLEPGIRAEQNASAALFSSRTEPSVWKRMPWIRITLFVWFVGAALFLARLALGAVRVRQLMAQSRLPAPSDLTEEFNGIRAQMGVRRAVRLAIHPTIASPLCSGLGGPTLLWPAVARDTTTVMERRAALVHELAHLRRYDDVVQLAGELWRAVCWFFVPIHWTLSHLQREQEFLCDDLAAGTLDSAKSYAKLLLYHAPVRVVAPTLCSSFVGGSAMADRIRRALRGEVGSMPLTPRQLSLLLVVGALLVFSAGSIRLIGFVRRAEAVEPAGQSTVEDQHVAESSDPIEELSAAEREAEEALRKVGASVVRDENGEVVRVRAPGSPQFTDAHLEYLTDLQWAKSSSETTYSGGPLPSLHVLSSSITDDGLKHLKELTSLKWIELDDNTQLTDAGLSHLAELTQLRWICLSPKITDDGLDQLVTALPNLEMVSIRGTRVTNEGLKLLTRLPNLVGLRIGAWGPSSANVHITDEGMENIAELRNLKELALDGTKVTDEGLAYLKELRSLRRLLLNNTEISDEGLRHLKELPALEWLGLGGTKITDGGLANLERMASLKELQLHNTQVSDAGLEHLKALANLESLWLSGTRITDAGLVHLEGLTKLQRLGLYEDPRITDTGLEHLKRFKDLYWLALDEASIGDQGLAHLKGLTNLTHLGLFGTGISDDGLANLAVLTRLRRLNLASTAVSDAGLKDLEGLSNLEFVDLRDTNVTEQGVERLQSALPDCEIEFR